MRFNHLNDSFKEINSSNLLKDKPRQVGFHLKQKLRIRRVYNLQDKEKFYI